jgi:probable O-glycosylation ligase (exosortase A-associated)
MHTSTLREWWRPDVPQAETPAATWSDAGEAVGGRLAFASLVAFTLILFTAPQERIPALAALRIALLAGVTAFISYWVDRMLTTRPAPPRSLEVRLVYALVAWAVLTLPLSLWPGGSVETLNEYVKAVLVFWLIGATLLTVGRLRLMAWTLSLASMPLAVTAILNYGAGVYDDGRVTGYQSGIAENPNDLALTLNIVLPLTAALLWSARTLFTRLALVGIIALNAAGVVVTFSRGGFLTLLVIIALLTLRLLRGRGVMAGVAVLVALLAAMPLLPEGYLDRLATIGDVESDPTGSSQDRWRDTTAAAGLLLEHPVMGVGLGQDVLALNEVRGETWKNVHNIYLQYGVDLGLIGMGLFVAMLVFSIRGARRVEREGRGHADPDRQDLAMLAAAVRIGLLAFAVAGLFHPVAYYFYFYYLAGLAVAVQRTADMSAANPAPVRSA